MTDAPIPPVDLVAERAQLGSALDEAVLKTLHSGTYVLGPEVAAFERDFAQAHRAKHGVAVGSGTDALILALKALGVEPGDHVVTSPFTFFASAGSIAWIGAKPVLADIDPATGLMDVDAARAACDSKTTCVLPVHIYGQLVDLKAYRKLADEKGIKLLEDAAQAHAAERDGLRAGEVGDAAAFSFYPTKNLGTAGEGGAILCNDDAVLTTLQRLRDHGSSAKYQHAMVGTNSRLHAMHAAILNVKLPYLEDWNQKRRANAKRYDELFAGSDVVRPLTVAPGSTHAYHQYGVRVSGDGARDRVLSGLHERKIFAAIHYPRPVHLQEAAASWGYGPGDFPHAEQLSNEILCLPIHPFLTPEQLERVASSVLELAS
ncbi:MAG: DegT/DnrJ/EryC1/StrS family aminotransferase [Planctomycetes bacterium]|nr:DegT/DnrJ/EryC1/StrS family aminotransferase [Planctomycetota bacterium]